MRTIIKSVEVSLVLLLASCSRSEHHTGTPVAQSQKYGTFVIGANGDSYCGTIATNPPIQFDCGRLAGAIASGGVVQADRRCFVHRTPRMVAVTITQGPGRGESYYPINVFSLSQEVSEQELKDLAYAIEAAVMRK